MALGTTMRKTIGYRHTAADDFQLLTLAITMAIIAHYPKEPSFQYSPRTGHACTRSPTGAATTS